MQKMKKGGASPPRTPPEDWGAPPPKPPRVPTKQNAEVSIVRRISVQGDIVAALCCVLFRGKLSDFR